MRTFSFRAECQHDVDAFEKECFEGLAVVTLRTSTKDGFPDVEVEIDTSANIEEIRAHMRNVADGHVMLQTLRECPLVDNSLERNLELDGNPKAPDLVAGLASVYKRR